MVTKLLLSSAAPVFLCLLPSAARSQSAGLRPRALPTKPARTALHEGSDPCRVVLKLLDDSGARSEGGSLVADPAGPGLAEVLAVLGARPGLRVEPLFPTGGSALESMRRGGEARTREALADLRTCFHLLLPAGEDAAELCDALNSLDDVEIAYPSPLPAPPPGDIPPLTPNFTSLQGYRAAAPQGIGVDLVAGQPGATGAAVTVADVEYNWVLTHEDLMTEGPGALLGPSPAAPYEDHGTAVAGILVADVDGWGVSGLCPASNLRVVAALTAGGLNVAAAIVLATASLAAGDVILLEQQVVGPFGTYLPVEYYDAEFYAIRQATALGLHVVEAAGNGAQNLDAYPVFQGRDSGAAMVAAASSTVPAGALSFSNRGGRCDAYAWGDSVATLGYGYLFSPLAAAPEDQEYTSSFGGTSSASAIVTGAVSILESTHFETHGSAYDPEALRLLLRTVGTPPASGSPPIGRMPDLALSLPIVRTGRNAAAVFSGTAAGERNGWSVASPGDIDGDGRGEVLIGSPFAGASGRAQVFRARDGALLHTFTGAAPFDGFGTAVCAAGDVDGDGTADVALGAPWNDEAGSDAGRAYVFSGATGLLLQAPLGEAAGDWFGFAVAGIGDVDGDGKDDLAVGAPHGDAGGPDAGRVYIHSGATGSVLFTVDGESPGDFLGGSLAEAGDVDGDGLRDLVVGAWTSDAGGTDAGRVYLLSGATGVPLLVSTGEAPGDLYGFSVSGAGDADGDGIPEIAVGAPGSDFEGTDAGRAYLVGAAGGSAIQVFPGEAAGDAFGTSVSGVGDAEGDGLADLLVGAPLNDRGGTDAGRAYLLRGITGKPLHRLTAQSTGEWFGLSASGKGDLTGDGRPDLIVGAPLCGPSESGRGYTFLGGPSAPPLPPGLVAIPPSLRVGTGGTASLQIRAGPAHAGAPYVLAVGISGSVPGFAPAAYGLPAPPTVGVPVNVDGMTVAALLGPNSPPFSGFVGTLDPAGGATATLTAPPSALAPLLDETFSLAAFTLPSAAFVSNPASVAIVP